MSSYIQGSVDYIPQVQPFVPDYGFYGNALQFKQSRSDNARQQLGTVYGSLLNSPLTRSDNVETRESFFRAIETDIQRMTGMDLSLEQNVESAKNIFTQLLDNKAIVKDMVWTKQFDKEVQRANAFKNCTDPEKCGGGWWEGGERLLQYAKESFKQSSLEDSLLASSPTFVPYQDITKKALKLAKEADLNIEIDELTGGWITTTKNGPALAGPLQQLLMGAIGSDPAVVAYYRAQAELQRKDYAFANAAKFGSVSAAEQDYIMKMSPIMNAVMGNTEAGIVEASTNNQKKLEKLEKAKEQALPREGTYLQQLVDEFHNRQKGYNTSAEVVKELSGEITVARNKGDFSSDQIDRILGMAQLSQDIGNQAQMLAFKDYTKSVKVNPYSLEAVQFKNRMLLEETRFRNDFVLKQLENSLDESSSSTSSKKGKKSNGLQEREESQGPSEQNIPNVITNVPGAVSVGETDTGTNAFLERGFDALSKDRDGMRSDLSINEKMIMGEAISRAAAAADNGDVQAKEDYVSVVKALISAANKGSGIIGVPNEALDPNTGKYTAPKPLYGKREYAMAANALNGAKTVDEAYAYARAIGGMLKLDEISGTQIDHIYNKSVSKMLDPSIEGNAVLRDYLSPMRNKQQTINAQRLIATKQAALSNIDKWYAEEAKGVVTASAAVNTFGPNWSDAFSAYIDNEGYVVDEETFVNKMFQMNYNPELARAMYRGDIGGNEGIHQKWKRAFTTLAKPSGDRTWLGVQGMGDEAVMGQNYPVVDPKNYRSTAMLGVTSFLNDAFANSETLFSIGGFRETLSVERNNGQVSLEDGNSDVAKQIANTLMSDLSTMTDDEDRPILNITYSDIAGGDGTKVGLNIKFNQKYLDQYKGTDKKPGLMEDTNLMYEGLTIYVDKSTASNLFTQSSKQSDLEKTMKWTGKLDFRQYPEYVKNFNVVSDPSTGNYKVSGHLMTGYNENNNPLWQYHEMSYPASTDLNDLVKRYDMLLQQVADKNKGFETNWSIQNLNK